jgi:GNAT superfamily N-acetyltransferase
MASPPKDTPRNNVGEASLKHLPADHPHAQMLVEAYFAELVVTLGAFDPSRSVSAAPSEMAPPQGTFVVLYDEGEPVGCGGLKTYEPGVGEIKRMFVLPSARRRGHSKRILNALEEASRSFGHRKIVLDTADPLREAAALYLRSGYREIPAYNDNPYAARWFEKAL